MSDNDDGDEFRRWTKRGKGRKRERRRREKNCRLAKCENSTLLLLPLIYVGSTTKRTAELL